MHYGTDMNYLELLFPTILSYEMKGKFPRIKEDEDLWNIFNPDSDNSLINQLKETFESLKLGINLGKYVIIDQTEGPVYIDENTKIDDFVRIEGPCYIGKGVKIKKGAYIRKGSWICEDAVVGHCSEIKNSLLMTGSKAPHFNYVGDSILGNGVNLGAGVKLSNVRNDRKKISIITKEGDRIRTNLKKMGSIIGDGCGLGCNVVANPGTIIEPYTMISPNKTVGGWVNNKILSANNSK